MISILYYRYAAWEEAQKCVDRARSVFERALDVEHRNISLWIKYAEMEMRNKQVRTYVRVCVKRNNFNLPLLPQPISPSFISPSSFAF